MQSILHGRYYNKGNLEIYLVQTQSQAKFSRIKLPEIHGVSKGLDPGIKPEKWVINPLVLKVKRNVTNKTNVKARESRIKTQKAPD